MEILTLFENEYFRLLIIILFTIFFMILSRIIIGTYIGRIIKKNKILKRSTIKSLSIPLISLILIIGCYISMKNLTILIQYSFYIDSSFFIITTIILSLLASRIINVFLVNLLRYQKKMERPPILINKVIHGIIFVIALLIILDYFKIEITPFLATVGFGALAVGLALQSTLSNFFAGLHLISDRPIEVGDFIELEKDTNGIVEDIGWRSTRIRTLPDNLLIIPNAKLADSIITNFSKPKPEMAIWVPCGVSYESDLKKVEQVTLEIAKEIQQTTPGAMKDFTPVLRYREFGDSNINFITILRVDDPLMRFSVRSDFIKALKEKYDEENIEISWPIRKIYNIK
jgi:small-conductance mechanosensitive channel